MIGPLSPESFSVIKPEVLISFWYFVGDLINLIRNNSYCHQHFGKHWFFLHSLCFYLSGPIYPSRGGSTWLSQTSTSHRGFASSSTLKAESMLLPSHGSGQRDPKKLLRKKRMRKKKRKRSASLIRRSNSRSWFPIWDKTISIASTAAPSSVTLSKISLKTVLGRPEPITMSRKLFICRYNNIFIQCPGRVQRDQNIFREDAKCEKWDKTRSANLIWRSNL